MRVVKYVCPKCGNFQELEVGYHQRIWVKWIWKGDRYEEEFVDSEIDNDKTEIVCPKCGRKCKEVVEEV